MATHDVLIIGGGISGLAFAWHAARAGHRPKVLEAGPRLGGCLDSRRGPDGYWFELGAHTLYNSYGALLEIVEGCRPRPSIVARGDARKRFARLRDGSLTTMGPLSVFRQFSFLELATNGPRALFGKDQPGATTREHFSRLVGAHNYDAVLGPFLSAVPSQIVDDFPASGPGSLFKKRPRRKDVIKSFTFDGGLGALPAAIAREAGVETEVGAPAAAVRAKDGAFEVELADGRKLDAAVVAIATDPATAARLTTPVSAALATALSALKTLELESLGVVVARDAVKLPELAFVVPTGDVFWSAVTRDPVPDGRHRAFTFHFKPGVGRAAQRKRVAEVLGISEGAFETVEEKRTVLPSPGRDHAQAVASIDRALAGTRALALTGNYFAGMAIEDCIARAKSEWARVGGSVAAMARAS
ncbi:MAG TPA: FAD-dependent oxidoreductase [Kofleriaceae bacterium]|nr:FAD-dependent oxidoreductase [Kofleriaceae bacterium]